MLAPPAVIGQGSEYYLAYQQYLVVALACCDVSAVQFAAARSNFATIADARVGRELEYWGSRYVGPSETIGCRGGKCGECGDEEKGCCNQTCVSSVEYGVGGSWKPSQRRMVGENIAVDQVGGCSDEEIGTRDDSISVGKCADCNVGRASGKCGCRNEHVRSRVRGRWFEHNKRKKMNRKGNLNKQEVVDGKGNTPEWRKSSRPLGDQDCKESRLERSNQVGELQKSLEAKWKAENELAVVKAEQQLQLLQSRDMDKMKRMQSAQVMRTTEVCKVQTERAFGFLAKTGNVPGIPADGVGSVETVVSDSGVPSLTRSNGVSISPDSSASMQEFRKCQKDLLDAEKKLAQNEEAFERLAVFYPRECAAAREVAEMKTAYTLDSNGEAEYEVDGVLGPDGKIHVDNLNDIHGPNYAHKKYDEFRESMGEPYEY